MLASYIAHTISAPYVAHCNAILPIKLNRCRRAARAGIKMLQIHAPKAVGYSACWAGASRIYAPIAVITSLSSDNLSSRSGAGMPIHFPHGGDVRLGMWTANAAN